MSVIPSEYMIETSRSDKELSKVTISGYNKTNVLNKLVERLRLHDLSGSNFWIAELVASNHTELCFTKVIVFAASEININNVAWPIHFLKLYGKSEKLARENGRNNQTIRNVLAEMVTILALSNKKIFKPPKLGEIDFEMEYVHSKIIAKNNNLAKQILRNEDPRDLMLPINELASHIVLSRRLLEKQNDLLGPATARSEPFYWLAWFLEWDKNMSSNKVSDQGYQGAHRESHLYDSKFAKDPVWIVWDLLLGLAERFHTCDNLIADSINALYRLYTINFSKTKKAEKRCLLYNAVQYLVTDLDWRKSVFVDRTKVLQMVAGVNFTYQRIGHGAREWEHAIRPSSISNFIEGQSQQSQQSWQSWQEREKAIDDTICSQVDRLLSTPAVLGLNATETEKQQPPMIREFEARKESYDRPLRRRLTIEDKQIKPMRGLVTAPCNNLSLPVVSIAGAGCFYTDANAAKCHRREAPVETCENDELEVLIGLDDIRRQEEASKDSQTDDLSNDENLSPKPI